MKGKIGHVIHKGCRFLPLNFLVMRPTPLDSTFSHPPEYALFTSPNILHSHCFQFLLGIVLSAVLNYHKTNSTTVHLEFFGWLYSNMSLKVVIFFSVVLALGFLYFCGKWTKKYDRQQPYYFGKFDFRIVSWMTCIWSEFGLF